MREILKQHVMTILGWATLGHGALLQYGEQVNQSVDVVMDGVSAMTIAANALILALAKIWQVREEKK